MFRFQDNLPEVYINESRDFQLLARLSDVLFSGIKYDIDSMINVLDATLAKDRMLQLMCTKIGFFPKIEIDSQVLKYIIASFPYIIKNKGNAIGIQAAVNAILKAENNLDAVGEPRIIIVNADGDDLFRDNYTIYIYTTIQIYNQSALKELLRYVIPAGYAYKILSYNSILDGYDNPDILSQADIITALKVNKSFAAQLRLPETNLAITIEGSISDEARDRLDALADAINAYYTTEIVTPLTEKVQDKNNIQVTKLLGFEDGSSTDVDEIINDEDN